MLQCLQMRRLHVNHANRPQTVYKYALPVLEHCLNTVRILQLHDKTSRIVLRSLRIQIHPVCGGSLMLTLWGWLTLSPWMFRDWVTMILCQRCVSVQYRELHCLRVCRSGRDHVHAVSERVLAEPIIRKINKKMKLDC